MRPITMFGFILLGVSTVCMAGDCRIRQRVIVQRVNQVQAVAVPVQSVQFYPVSASLPQSYRYQQSATDSRQQINIDDLERMLGLIDRLEGLLGRLRAGRSARTPGQGRPLLPSLPAAPTQPTEPSAAAPLQGDVAGMVELIKANCIACHSSNAEAKAAVDWNDAKQWTASNLGLAFATVNTGAMPKSAKPLDQEAANKFQQFWIANRKAKK